MAAIIQAESVGKCYRIRHEARERYSTLRDTMTRGVKNLFRRGSRATVEDFWALRDVNFEIQQGEIVGVIGRNGAGKSTLLKVFSRITEPTTGRITLGGRVASLLEVGTGFHPELTGRENIFLNGAILGMSRAEIRSKFDEIVDFAEVEKFLDTPVKRYSSGMYVRLAFAVAAHLEPEILVVDEVLAVGDAEFQKKCLGKMSEVAKGGRTVLFVSHHMATVNRLCTRCILMDRGTVKTIGDTVTVTGLYMTSETGTLSSRDWRQDPRAPGDENVKALFVRVLQDGKPADSVDIRHPVTLEVGYEALKDDLNLIRSFSFFDAQGVHLFVAADFEEQSSRKPKGVYVSTCTVPGNLFSEGCIRVATEISTRHPVYQIHFIEFDSCAFQIVDNGEPGSVRAGWGRPIPGVMRPGCGWRTETLN